MFASGNPLSVKRIAGLLKEDPKHVMRKIETLKQECENQDRGVRIVISDTMVELITAPANFDVVKKLVNYEQAALTKAKIETLAILAYRGPLNRVALEEIRGVNCMVILKNLLLDQLIHEAPSPKGAVYAVSTQFLRSLGVTAADELPDYATFTK